ncbi:hypothetical protein Kpol_1058p9 [Vanderwaltozyma polyspora DSM 70294]|uniref:VASt domain-containing protein n=1 Tax=Vanderwaltozyma polyspora (strain ATCC 22028 / DSM 70294 / BCRC 21397 / CBS 2163 / NBRC 10782 / NRRL Y-8283 / UCD 57-17) TaxID=436907 RepID=A7TJP3_VANPO|nr:uncharacterized protein Kpol_1058p9 [Vanderwaltozyma polyspora DSM 70294]EDO17472.1 hypothetical protein Kpol_1058p9 [Vanderwaltozyma polyspora DSM 70294]
MVGGADIDDWEPVGDGKPVGIGMGNEDQDQEDVVVDFGKVSKDQVRVNTKVLAQTPDVDVEASGSPSSFMNIFTSFSGKSPSSPLDNIIEEKNSSGEKRSSPVIISHRRQPSGNVKRSNKRHSSSSSIGSPVLDSDKGKDKSERHVSDSHVVEVKALYSDDRYLDTQYYYASEDRNIDFHEIFKSAPQEDRLLHDFSCALSREFLYQGRMYITDRSICFNSNLLGWVSKLIIPMKDIIFMEKTSAAGLFANAISIETTLGKTQFNGFASRDEAFALMKEVWARVLIEEGERNPIEKVEGTESETTPLIDDKAVKNEEKADSKIDDRFLLNSAIDSVEYFSQYDSKKTVTSSSDDSELDGDSIFNEKPQLTKKTTVNKLQKGLDFKYNGPYTCQETWFPVNIQDDREELLDEFEIEAAPGLVYELMFGEASNKFWLDFSKVQKDTSDFSTITSFNEVNEKGKKYRKYSYTRELNHSMGPKSTKCIVTDTLEHLEYEKYINVVSCTQTPDVPSGGSFNTMTRYLFRWRSNSNCIVRISFWVDWVGSSWIKGLINSSCKSGQEDTVSKLKPFIQKFVQKCTEPSQVTALETTSLPEKIEETVEEIRVFEDQINLLMKEMTVMKQKLETQRIFIIVILFLLVVDILINLR